MDKKQTPTLQPEKNDSLSNSVKLYSIFEYPEYSSTASATGRAQVLSRPLDDSLTCHRSKMSEDQAGSFFSELFHVPMYEELPPGYHTVIHEGQRPELESLGYHTAIHEGQLPKLESDKHGIMVASQQLIRHQNERLHQQTSVISSADTPLRQTSVTVQQTAPVTMSYRSHITLACFTFWLCGVVFGSLAFFLAGREHTISNFCLYY